MKSSYKSRTGHEKLSNRKKLLNNMTKSRRSRVIERLEHQLTTGMKPDKKSHVHTLPLTTQDIARIEKELLVLKSRI